MAFAWVSSQGHPEPLAMTLTSTLLLPSRGWRVNVFVFLLSGQLEFVKPRELGDDNNGFLLIFSAGDGS